MLNPYENGYGLSQSRLYYLRPVLREEEIIGSKEEHKLFNKIEKVPKNKCVISSLHVSQSPKETCKNKFSFNDLSRNYNLT